MGVASGLLEDLRLMMPFVPYRFSISIIYLLLCSRTYSRSTFFFVHFSIRPCVFSPGAYINNRSLMPCQEPPIAMSTWQAAIHVPKGCTVLMSGNELPVQNSDDADTGMQFILHSNVF